MPELEVEPHAAAEEKAKKHTQIGQEIESRIWPPKCEGWSFTEVTCQAQLLDKNAQPVSQICLTTVGQVGNVGGEPEVMKMTTALEDIMLKIEEMSGTTLLT
ncbi:hypothetical protein OsJ_02047 [Oryza sativa Japonica Group]|uniref:Uncharacterized protein n=2 Tax=Oryza TaxID=4527 RepID=Q5QL80_ORYSJ|nr:hypothetical protein OsJ_02047 [Oryza sativa Japonica Group]BAD73841.1 hypothetical protein [Oryza sativa Japonica Group]